ncbi:unnamed protein product [Brassica rapa subsp. narinosa]
MGRGKFKGKPTGQRRFSSAAEILAGTSAARPRSFKQKEAEYEEDIEEESEEESEEEESEDESDVKKKGHEALIEVDNPNRAKPKTLKARDLDASKTTELSRREREELEKQRAHERYMRLQEQGKTEQARKDLDRLALIRQQREEAAKKREEEKAGKTKHYLFLKIQSLFLTVSDLILMSHFCCSERREESRCSQMSRVCTSENYPTL